MARLQRLFWIIVVLSGFTASGVLIYQSFQSWDESPVVTTTMETYPISEINFPKVAVCPRVHIVNQYCLLLPDLKVGFD